MGSIKIKEREREKAGSAELGLILDCFSRILKTKEKGNGFVFNEELWYC